MGAAIDTGKPSKGPKPSINVTPLVDVVLVLLIIFMVIIPNMQDGKPIELVDVFNPDKDAEDKLEPLTVTIDKDEVLTVGEADMSREAAIAELKAVYAATPKRRMILRGDARLRFVVLRGLFKDIQDIGFSGVSLEVAGKREWTQEEG
jgi:biopolymer transport protein ExbD